jgi:hypothetical protein
MATMNRRPRRDATSAAAAKSIADFDKLGIAPPVTRPGRDSGGADAAVAADAEGRAFGLGSAGATPEFVDSEGVEIQGRERDYRAHAPKQTDGSAAPFRVK